MTRKRARGRGAESPVSAQVILRSRSGRTFDGRTPITAENIREYVPSAEDVAAAQQAFASAGFEVGAMVGISFSITAPPAVFERFFGTRLHEEEGWVRVDRASDAERLQLPLDRLPPTLAGRVVAVTFSPPADLHLTDDAT